MVSSNRFETLIKPLLDAMQTMPSFGYLIPGKKETLFNSYRMRKSREFVRSYLEAPSEDAMEEAYKGEN
ncbi:hypothetical protein [Oceanobacillus senegalensis]|uniref:hypothetical protein n=1 Tax=Oceanobacillus senegalensis TaxID=1936063 RepID=UPI000A30564A|nr:hypothetical protein [Oceanobacillus senegalensis]